MLFRGHLVDECGPAILATVSSTKNMSVQSMFYQSALILELPLADAARERPVIRVTSQMVSHGALSVTHVCTVVTGVLLLARVESHVLDQITFVFIVVTAQVTFVWSVSSVDPHVRNQRALDCTGVGAMCTGIRLLAGVGPHVYAQNAHIVTFIVTVLARHSLHGMSLQMQLEFLFICECISTDVARQRPEPVALHVIG